MMTGTRPTRTEFAELPRTRARQVWQQVTVMYRSVCKGSFSTAAGETDLANKYMFCWMNHPTIKHLFDLR